MIRSRRLFVVGALNLAILGGGPGIGYAEEEEATNPRPDFAVDLAFVNKYVWRGMLLTDGPVFQPAATLGYKGASVGVWGNLDLDDVNDTEGEFNEIDLVLDYTHSINEFSVSGGLIYYDFPNTDFRSTVELYVAAGVDILLQPCLTVYFDVDQAEGIYGTLGLSHNYTTERLLGKMDHGATTTNAVAAMTPEKGRVPISLKTDKEAVEAALGTIGATDAEEARVVHIKNTLEMAEMEVSKALLEETKGRRDLELVADLGKMVFDGKGNFRPVAMIDQPEV